MKRLLVLTLLLLILVGCTPIAENIPPPVAVTDLTEPSIPDNPDGITIECEQGTVGCIGQTVPWVMGRKLPVPQAFVKATHEGDGEFSVRLGFADHSEQLLFQATGNYTSPTVTVATTDILTVTVQGTGPWKVDFERASSP